MPPYVFKLNGDAPIRYMSRSTPMFGRMPGDHRYRVIESEDVAESLREAKKDDRPYFTCITPEGLESSLDGTAEEAIEAIKSGSYDDVLDLLVHAEREVYGGRATVIGALAERFEELETPDEEEPGAPQLQPEDVARSA